MTSPVTYCNSSAPDISKGPISPATQGRYSQHPSERLRQWQQKQEESFYLKRQLHKTLAQCPTQTLTDKQKDQQLLLKIQAIIKKRFQRLQNNSPVGEPRMTLRTRKKNDGAPLNQLQQKNTHTISKNDSLKKTHQHYKKQTNSPLSPGIRINVLPSSSDTAPTVPYLENSEKPLIHSLQDKKRPHLTYLDTVISDHAQPRTEPSKKRKHQSKQPDPAILAEKKKNELKKKENELKLATLIEALPNTSSLQWTLEQDNVIKAYTSIPLRERPYDTNELARRIPGMHSGMAVSSRMSNLKKGDPKTSA